MTEEFAARRAAARKRLDAIDPAKGGCAGEPGRLDDPYRRDWFRAVYDLAGDDPACVPWADLAPHPLLDDWLQYNFVGGLRALDVGCGLGDNAMALAEAGARVSALDLSDRAITWARRRFPDSDIDFRAADLFAPPAEWRGAFDFLHECYTLQALPASLLPEAARALADFLAPGGRILVIARARDEVAAAAGPPWPLARADVELFTESGLELSSLERIAPPGESAHWRAVLKRAA